MPISFPVLPAAQHFHFLHFLVFPETWPVGRHGKSKDAHFRIPGLLTNVRKHSQSKSDSRRCTAQTDIPVKTSAAVPRWPVEPATTSRSATPHDESLSPEYPSHSRPVHPQLYRQPLQSDSLDCTVCRESNAVCNHARPQCSHCYQQQTLCFYVSPGQRPESEAKIWRWLDHS